MRDGEPRIAHHYAVVFNIAAARNACEQSPEKYRSSDMHSTPAGWLGASRAHPSAVPLKLMLIPCACRDPMFRLYY